MIHRDIKPHNLMATPSGQIKILDFGLANFATEVTTDKVADTTGEKPASSVGAIHHLTQMGAMMGTPDYIAPEQAKDAHDADIRADIYSLGCTFFMFLTGQAPFRGGSLMEKINAHSTQQLPPLSDFRDDVPADVEAILQRMTAKDPAARFQIPADVIVALEAIDEGLPRPVEKPASETSSRTKRLVRPTMLLGSIVALVVVAVVAAIVFYVQTDYGVVRVEVVDETLEVTLDGNRFTVKDGDKPLTIRPGKQKLVIRQVDSDFEYVTEAFHLRRDDEIVLKVDLLEGEVVVTKNGRRFGGKRLGDAVEEEPPPNASRVTVQLTEDGELFLDSRPSGRQDLLWALEELALDQREKGLWVEIRVTANVSRSDTAELRSAIEKAGVAGVYVTREQ